MNPAVKTHRRAAVPTLLLFLAVALLAGCTGSANNNAVPYDPVKGHPADFVTTHPTFAMRDTNGCTPCHGIDLKGGTSLVSCSSASWNGIACHGGGPGHGTQDWVDNVHFLRAKASLASCQLCHGGDLQGGTSGLSCYAASFDGFGACHTSGPDHLLQAATWVVTSSAVPNVVQGHQTAALPDGASCRPCHAANYPADNTLSGGKSGVSCSSASRSGFSCHATGPGFHPTSWLDCTVRGTNSWHGTVAQNNPGSCTDCHGLIDTSPKCTQVCHYTSGGRRVPSLSSWIHPTIDNHALFTDNAVNSVCVNCHATHNKFGQQPVCHNCHPPFPGGNHDNGWLLSHAPAARAGTASCAAGSGTSTCHGTNLAGGSGRACTACHAGEALASHLADCRSCHGNPPPGSPALSQPTGYPNVAGAHAKHAALPGVTCATCHSGAGMTTARHFDNLVQVAFPTAYNAQSGTASFLAGTLPSGRCNTVKCHGGQLTPDWRTAGSLACAACHKASTVTPAQYNDYGNSPFTRHTYHIGRGIACTTCHNSTWLAVPSNHWPNLTSTTMPAAAPSLNSMGYVSPGNNECTSGNATGCHGD
jgi:hypothetical protein